MPFKDPEKRREKAREYSRAYTAKNPGWRKERPSYGQQYGAIPNEVSAAQRRVYIAIKRGELVRPTVCPECGLERFCEAAHLNYTERLAIVWRCRSCHRRMDAAAPRGGRTK